MGKQARAAPARKMQSRAAGGGLVLAATGISLGEGFDFSELKTLVLAFPVAFKDRIVKFVEREPRPTASSRCRWSALPESRGSSM